MTPEQDILAINARYNYDYYNRPQPQHRHDVYLIEKFGSVSEFKKAGRIYWSYNDMFNISPASDAIPPVKAEDWAYYREYRELLLGERLISKYETK